MGIDAGFDMVPRLSKSESDKRNWQLFIDDIKNYYQNDGVVEVKLNYIVFKAGEHPSLPFEGHKFLRFSSKISGSHAEGVDEYIDTVTKIARTHFGSRIQKWNDGYDAGGFYDWQEVNDSLRSYEQRTEPENLTESLMSMAQSTSTLNTANKSNQQLLKIESVLGKGQGVLAHVNIAKGDRILCEKPLFTTRNLSSLSAMEADVATKVKALSKTEQRQFLALHNNFPGKHPFSGIVKTNALPCGSDSVIGGVYPTICRINHSCLPNAHNNWNDETNVETIHAIRDIKSGEEVTISYDRGGPCVTRRAYLKKAFGFDCNCENCTLGPAALDISDARRLKIQDLDSAIGDPMRAMSRPGDCLSDCRLLLQVFKEEYGDDFGAWGARLYYDAFQICIMHSDQARASILAERSYQSRVVCEGDDSPAARRVKGLSEDPTQHMSFETTRKWKLAKRFVPKGLDAKDFEEWLWRRCT